VKRFFGRVGCFYNWYLKAYGVVEMEILLWSPVPASIGVQGVLFLFAQNKLFIQFPPSMHFGRQVQGHCQMISFSE
jgi:hypothetical protein